MTASMPMSMTVSFCSPLNGSHHHIIFHSSSQKIASHHTYSVTHTEELKWFTHKMITAMQSRTRLRAASTDNNADDNKEPASISDTSRDDLAAKLAAAEAEAEALRRELAARKGNREIDLSKLKPAIPEKRIDGVGYRETIFSAPGKAMGTEVEQPSKWGLSEAELFLSKGAPSERTQIGSPPIEDNSKEIVTRRLLIGTGLALSAIGLAYFKLPAVLVKPSKPLFVYVIPILQLREQLMTIENFASDVNSVRFQLKKINDSDDFSKDTFLSAAGYLEGADRDTASSITYSIFDYLNQADYNKYFEYMGQPSVSQQLDFLKFSLKSIEAAREQIDKFLSLIPQEELQAAKSQNMRNMD